MSRYNANRQIKDEMGRRYTSTTIIPSIPNDPSDIYIRVYSEERLDLLAFRFYGDANKWWIIATANNLGKGSLIVPSNTRLRIPINIQNIQAQIESFNANR